MEGLAEKNFGRRRRPANFLTHPRGAQWAEGYKKYFQIWNFWSLIDPWYLIRRAKIINSVFETLSKKNSNLNTVGSTKKILSFISKNDVFWPLYLSATFRDREL